MPPNITVPIEEAELEEILQLIQRLLKSDEAGPAFFIATNKWKQETKYEEEPF